MKKLLFVSVVVATVILFSANLFSQNFSECSVQINENQITTNLLVGIQSCNKGLCASCTYLLGEFCCKKSVIPLLDLLHNAQCEENRILAALSLIKIGDGRGVFAVNRAGIYDESARVRKLCNLFYKAFLAGKVSNSIIQKDSPILNERIIAEN